MKRKDLRMTTTIEHQRHKINSTDARRRQIRAIQVIFTGAATIATLALFSLTQPGGAGTVVASGPVRLVDYATDRPAPATAAFGMQFPQAQPSVLGDGSFAADDNTSTSNDTVDNSNNGSGENPSSGDIFTQNALDQSTA